MENLPIIVLLQISMNNILPRATFSWKTIVADYPSASCAHPLAKGTALAPTINASSNASGIYSFYCDLPFELLYLRHPSAETVPLQKQEEMGRAVLGRIQEDYPQGLNNRVHRFLRNIEVGDCCGCVGCCVLCSCAMQFNEGNRYPSGD